VLFRSVDTQKNYDVGFCGNINNRGEWINEINKNFNFKLDEFVIGRDMVNSINSYKIHFNRNILDDLNYRTFETLGCKTFLITNETPGLRDLFEIDKHLVTYDSIHDLFEKINYYLNNPIERVKIESNGYDHVLQNHTYKKRMEYFVNEINKLI
jgi:spore maturation protein CgeB